MAFVSEIFDQIRDLLDDASDTQVTFANKKLYVNNGIRRMWPMCHRILSDVTTTLVEDTYTYSLPAGLNDGDIISMFVETDEASGEFVRLSNYSTYSLDDGSVKLWFQENVLPAPAGATIRVNWLEPISLVAATTYAAAQAEVWTGRVDQIHIPAYYAMAMIAARKIDNRQDTNRYSTTQAENGVTDSDIMESSQMWMGQFELELERQSRPFPIARD